MTYSDLKQWFDEWREGLPDQPIPLVMGKYAFSRDVRVTIESFFKQIEAVPVEERKKSKLSSSAKKQLIDIKQFIEEGDHDISSFGYSINSNYIQSKTNGK